MLGSRFDVPPPELLDVLGGSLALHPQLDCAVADRVGKATGVDPREHLRAEDFEVLDGLVTALADAARNGAAGPVASVEDRPQSLRALSVGREHRVDLVEQQGRAVAGDLAEQSRFARRGHPPGPGDEQLQHFERERLSGSPLRREQREIRRRVGGVERVGVKHKQRESNGRYVAHDDVAPDERLDAGEQVVGARQTRAVLAVEPDLGEHVRRLAAVLARNVERFAVDLEDEEPVLAVEGAARTPVAVADVLYVVESGEHGRDLRIVEPLAHESPSPSCSCSRSRSRRHGGNAASTASTSPGVPTSVRPSMDAPSGSAAQRAAAALAGE